MNYNLRETLDRGPMCFNQWLAVAVCVILSMLDGFDVLVMAFTASSVAKEWALAGTQVGMLLSAGLLGMAIGSLFIAPLADRIGRRTLTLYCLLLCASGMILASITQSMWQLAAMRLLTGLGIGGILVCVNVISSEVSSLRWRALAVSLQSTGYALGATCGGLLAVWLMGIWGWRSVFFVGGLLSLLVIPMVLAWVPESLDFLLARRPSNALARINKIAKRFGHAPLDALPVLEQGPKQGVAIFQLWKPELLRSTLVIWATFFIVMFGFYFIMSWTPKLLVDSGMSTSEGVTGGVLLSIGGIFGSTVIGMLAARIALKYVLQGYMLMSALLLLAFYGFASELTYALALGLFIGFFSNGCVGGLYALTPQLYPATVRSTGLGWAIGVGRLGAILSPVVAGVLLDFGWQPLNLYAAFALVFILAIAVLAFLPKAHNR